MKKLITLFATLLVVLVANAQDQDFLPKPFYFNDFSSSEGLAIVGNGQFVYDSNVNFGRVFRNDPTLSKSIRKNYLVLPNHVLSGSTETKQMSIGFWVNKKDAADFYWSPIFSAYAKMPADDGTNTFPMFVCTARGTVQVNDYGYCDFGDDLNDLGANTASTAWLDDTNWHYYTITLTETRVVVYVDGEVVNSWTINEENGQHIAEIFTHPEYLPYICLGGNQAWGYNDPDPAFAFDDFAVYDYALSGSQIKHIMANKLAYVPEVSNLYSKTLADWTTADLTTTAGTLSAWYTVSPRNYTTFTADNANGLYLSAGADNATATLTYAAPKTNSIVTIDAVFNNAINTGNSGNYTYLKIGNSIEIRSNQQNQNGEVIIDGVSYAISDCNKKNYNRGGDLWTIHAVINTATKQLEAFTLLGNSTSAKNSHFTLGSPIVLSSDFVSTIVVGKNRAGGTPAVGLNSISIAEQTQDVTPTTYTINYLKGTCDNCTCATPVKSVSGINIVGAPVAVPARAIVGDDNNTYFVNDDVLPSMTLTEFDDENVLNVYVHSPRKAEVYINYQFGNNEPTEYEKYELEENGINDDKPYDAYFTTYWESPAYKYCEKEGIWYQTRSTDYCHNFTFTDDFTRVYQTIAYTLPDKDVVFFTEGSENSTIGSQYSDMHLSYVAAGNRTDGIYVWHRIEMHLGGKNYVDGLEEGAYEMIGKTFATNKRNLALRDYTSTETASEPIAQIVTNSVASNNLLGAGFILKDDKTNLIINGRNDTSVGKETKTNQSEDFDWIVIKKAKTITCETVENGTIATDKVACSAGMPVKITLTPNANCKLVSARVYDDLNNTIPVTNMTFTMPATNVRITATFKNTEEARPTQISEVNAENGESADVYNMAGQRVNANAKGLVVKNGKKAILK